MLLPPPRPTRKSICCLPCDGHARIDHLRRGVFDDPIETRDVDTCRGQRLFRPLDVSRGDDSRVGDQQHAGSTIFANKFPQLLDSPGAEHDSRPWLEIKNWGDFGVHEGIFGQMARDRGEGGV